MVKFNRKGTMNFPGMVQVTQEDVPSNATRVMNPMGHVSHAPAGTIYANADGGFGGDGCQYNGNIADGQKWNGNPIPQHQCPDEFQPVPYMLPFSRKLKK